MIGLVEVAFICRQIVYGEFLHLRRRQVQLAAQVFKRTVVFSGRKVVVRVALDHVDVKRYVRMRGDQCIEIFAVPREPRCHHVGTAVGVGQIFPAVDEKLVVLDRHVRIPARQAHHGAVPDLVLRVIEGLFHRLRQRDLIAERGLHGILKRTVEPAFRRQRSDGVGRAVFVVVDILRAQQCTPEPGQQHGGSTAEHDRVAQVPGAFAFVGVFHVRFLLSLKICKNFF